MRCRDNSSRVGERQATKTGETKSSLRRRAFQFAGKCSLLGTVALGVGLAGASIDPVETEIGPHRAEVSLSTSEFVSIDTGALGPARIKSPNSFLGVDIALKEIVATGDIAGEVPSFSELEGELSPAQLERFAALYEGAADDSEEIPGLLLEQFAKYSLLGGALTFAGYKILGKKVWQRLDASEKKSVLLTGLLLAGSLQIRSSHENEGWVSTDDALSGTPLEGMEVKGEVLRLAVPAVKQLMDFLDENKEFYQMAEDNISELADRGILPPKEEGSQTFIFVTDRHCNQDMNGPISKLSDIVSADILLSSGDDSFSGTEFEQRCFDDLAIGGQNVIALGNHDDDAYSRLHAEKAGFTVLDGETEAIANLNILGDTDPERTIFGQESYLWRSETREEMAIRLARLACSSEIKPIILVHDPKIGRPALELGCTNTVFSGHTHKMGFEEVEHMNGNTGVLIIGGTSGGAADGRPTIGPLKNKATITIGQLDSSGRVLNFRRVVVETDASVRLGDLEVVND